VPPPSTAAPAGVQAKGSSSIHLLAPVIAPICEGGAVPRRRSSRLHRFRGLRLVPRRASAPDAENAKGSRFGNATNATVGPIRRHNERALIQVRSVARWLHQIEP